MCKSYNIEALWAGKAICAHNVMAAVSMNSWLTTVTRTQWHESITKQTVSFDGDSWHYPGSSWLVLGVTEQTFSCSGRWIRLCEQGCAAGFPKMGWYKTPEPLHALVPLFPWTCCAESCDIISFQIPYYQLILSPLSVSLCVLILQVPSFCTSEYLEYSAY